MDFLDWEQVLNLDCLHGLYAKDSNLPNKLNLRNFGKDEVGSSNLPSSSTKTPLSQDSGVFIMIFVTASLLFGSFAFVLL